MPDVKRRGKRLLDGAISAGQCKAARGFLGISQEELADEAKISRMTVQDFEKGARSPHANNLAALKSALERKGVVFLEPEEGFEGVLFPKV